MQSNLQVLNSSKLLLTEYIERLKVGTMVRGCRCAMSLCDLDLTFDLAVVTLTNKILSGLYLGNRKV